MDLLVVATCEQSGGYRLPPFLKTHELQRVLDAMKMGLWKSDPLSD